MNKFVAIDTETTGLNTFRGARPFLYIATTRDEFGSLKTIVSRDINDISHLLLDASYDKVFHNAKFDLLMLKSIGYVCGTHINGNVYDTMIAKHLLDENTSSSLDFCGQKYLNVKKLSDEVGQWFKDRKINKADKRYDELPDDLLFPYAKMDGEITYMLWEKFKPALEAQNLWELFLQECKLIHVLINMHVRGVAVDVEYFKKVKEQFQTQLDRLQADIYIEADKMFDILSGPQLAKVLIDNGAKLPTTEKGNFQTSKDAIESVDHPIAKMALEYRHKQKMISTYFDAMIYDSVDGVIHADLFQIGTVTGRFSCANPNLQNIPRHDEIVRRGFTCRPGYYDFYIDYDQQEYRVFMSYAKEQWIVDAINNDNADFHTLVYNELKEYFRDRDDAKTFNFMLIYGGGVAKLASMLGISFDKAKSLKVAYFGKFKNVKAFMNNVMFVVQNRGFIFNKFGRRRRLRSSEAYKAINSLIQGVCADYIKERMILLDAFLADKKSNLLLQIHDELKFEIHESELHLIPEIIAIMEDSMGRFGVKLTVEPKWTKTNWAEKVKYKLNDSEETEELVKESSIELIGW